MKLYLYRPAGQIEPHTLPCIFMAPAGATVLSGMSLGEGDRTEHYPWALAGYFVVSYEIDGDVGDLAKSTVADLQVAFRKFAAAEAGLTNARLAMRTALASCPEIDPQQLFVVGHSSAATLALILAENEPNLRGCVAFAPVSNMVERASDGGGDLFRLVPGSEAFVQKYSPHLHVQSFGCPLYLFHAQDDDNVPFQQSQTFANLLRGQGKEVHLAQTNVGGHYESMVKSGIPLAIDWLAKQRGIDPRRPAAKTPPAKTPPAQPDSPAETPVAGPPPIPMLPGFPGRPETPKAKLAPGSPPAQWQVESDGVELTAGEWSKRRRRAGGWSVRSQIGRIASLRQSAGSGP